MPETVCFYINFFESYTGGPQVVRNLTERLDPARFRPYVITNRPSPLCDDLTKRSIEFEILPQPETLAEAGGATVRTPLKRLWNSMKALGYNRKIYRILRKQNCALVWSRNIKGTLLTGFAAKALRIPLIWDIGMEKKSSGAIGRLHRLGFQLSDAIVTEGACVAPSIFPPKLCEKYQHKIQVIKSGIPDDRVAEILKLKADKKNCADRVTVINIASICQRKNQRLLLDAMLPLMQDRENLDLKLVGPPVEEAYQKELVQMVADANMESRIEFLGWRSDALELLVNADIFALTSFVEGVPYSILEAMYAEVAIVSTRCGGVPDVVTDGESGFVVDDFQPDTFRRRVGQLVDDVSRRNRFCENAYAFASQNHTSSVWSSRYMELFSEILERRRARPGR